MTQDLFKTPLWDVHQSFGAKMAPFAGYDMPLQYEGLGVMQEHLHTRENAGLFDVSHMGQVLLTGDDPATALETLVPSDIKGLAAGKMRYTVLLNDKGGIVDDLMVTRVDDNALYLVVNAGCKDKDFALLKTLSGVKMEMLDDRALIALQGPKAEAVLAGVLGADAASGVFMTMQKVDSDFGALFVSRSGYTGEDGFEISVPAGAAERFAQKLLAHPDVKPIGLGARDSLRLEAGLCLYGYDLDEDTTPIEANLKWAIQKRRRAEGGFKGADIILPQIENGVARMRIGIKPEGRAPVREGTELFSKEGKKIGIVTSGGFGPTVGGPVAMGYVETECAKDGTPIDAMVRGTKRPCVVVRLPFVTQQYKKG
ncbi:MAG: glycine cleavage system aminomethyltransferase GcvT [Alphaproteobacteria bacterium]|nr:glycine cleavage system aminomethyltransferase GcvT [Alphaproteobacteria bacterium]